MIDASVLAAKFRQQYGCEPRLFHAPGRVNLIGEHTDYNDGFVLPMAIHQGTTVAIAARSDRILRARSLNLDEAAELDLATLGPGRSGTWRDYVEGVAAALLARGAALKGADILLQSDVPIGGGLSSSAALEMSLGLALLTVSGSALDKRSLALAGQAAEHRHVGIQCGIMDQYTSAFAVKDHAVLLDCRSLESTSIPLRLQDCQIVVCDTRVRHALASSEYNLRRKDCEAGVKLLGASLPGIRALRDVTLPQLDSSRRLLPSTVFQRCRHVVSENERTLKAAKALAEGDVMEMGKLMSASHRSLKDDYQVSCRELDLLVEIAGNHPGVLGSRMTGGGFGGCTVNLVKRSHVFQFSQNVSREYQDRTGIAPAVFDAESADGAREIFPSAHP